MAQKAKMLKVMIVASSYTKRNRKEEGNILQEVFCTFNNVFITIENVVVSHKHMSTSSDHRSLNVDESSTE